MIFPWLPKALARHHSFTGKPRIWPMATCLALSVAVALLGVMGAAEASQSPAGCNANGVTLTLSKNPDSVANGGVVTFTVQLANPAGGGDCDASTVTISGFCPDANGNPKSTPAVTFPTIANLPAGTAQFSVGSFPCTVSVNPGVTAAQGLAQTPPISDPGAAILHDNPNRDDPFQVAKTLSVGIVAPDMSVTKSCVFATASSVSVTGAVNNTGNDALQNLQCSDSTGETLTLAANSIAAGGVTTYSGTFSATSPHTDTVTCTAVGTASQVQLTRQASATCAFVPPPPPPNQIPTLSGWVMILLAVFLAMVGATVLRRKPAA